MKKEELVKKMLEKSTEAFLMAVEIYNKPTIKYRVEGFAMFICNSWELMLKAYMINKFGEDSIYYKDNPDRTLTLENYIRKVFTNDKDPLRLNLIKIIELRNTSTHFITEEYEMVYIPLFQACIFNYVEKINKFHEIDITKIMPQNFLTLTVSMHGLDENEIRAKYPEEIAKKIINTNNALSPVINENNHNFAIKIEHHHYLTKDKDKATSFVHIDNTAEAGVKVIKELKDPNNTHKYTAKHCFAEINKRLAKLNIDITLNMSTFLNFCKYYNIKENEKLCYVYKMHAQPQYSYSIQAIDFIVEEIKKDPENILENIKNRLTPGAKEF